MCPRLCKTTWWPLRSEGSISVANGAGVAKSTSPLISKVGTFVGRKVLYWSTSGECGQAPTRPPAPQRLSVNTLPRIEPWSPPLA